MVEKSRTFPTQLRMNDSQSTGFSQVEREERLPSSSPKKTTDHRKTSPISLARSFLGETKTGLACIERCLGLALVFLQSVHTLIRCSLADQLRDRSASGSDFLFR